MNGIILFADDHVFDVGRHENRLFNKLNNIEGVSILPINNLNVLEKTVTSISTYRAIILDWNFRRTGTDDLDLTGVEIGDENPLSIITENPLYSLIYIYSENLISDEIQKSLLGIYGGKIQFRQKVSAPNEIDNEVNKIVSELSSFQEEYSHMLVPFQWSRAINKSSQLIFSELEKSDKFWIKDLFYSSVQEFDNSNGEPKSIDFEPSFEVVNLLHSLLRERLIQDDELRTVITEYSIAHFKEQLDGASTLNLYSTLYYTSTSKSDVVMTGDIYKLSEECYGIIISPECDIAKLVKKDKMVEVLCFDQNSFSKILNFIKKPTKKMDEAEWEKYKNETIERAYNQEIPAVHLLPAFTFGTGLMTTALVDFRFGLRLVKGKYLDLDKGNRTVKLNSPYIQQLRQRYLSYIGRVGVPTIPNSIRITDTSSK